jgi:iron complex transport system substrate-binding protein
VNQARRLINLIFLGALLLGGFLGCGPHAGLRSQLSSAKLTVADDFGVTVSLAKPPRRIICLAPNLTEIAFAIGLGDRVVGVVEYSDYPPAALRKALVGRHDHPNLESIVALHPDLVLMGFGNPGEIGPALRRSGISVFGANPKSIKDVLALISRIGKLCGVPAQAAQLTEQLQARLDRIRQQLTRRQTRPPRVFIMIDQEPLWTAGADTLQDEIVRLAGGENVAASRASYFAFSKEALVAAQPDFILLPARPEEVSRLKHNLLARKDLAGVKAIREGKILVVDADSFSRPGPRLVKAVEETYQLLSQPQSGKKEPATQKRKY